MDQLFCNACGSCGDQKASIAVDSQSAEKTNHVDVDSNAFADLLKQLAEMHYREVAQLHSEITCLREGDPHCSLPHAILKHETSESAAEIEDTGSPSNVFAESLPTSLSPAEETPLILDLDDVTMEQDMEVASEKLGSVLDNKSDRNSTTSHTFEEGQHLVSASTALASTALISVSDQLLGTHVMGKEYVNELQESEKVPRRLSLERRVRLSEESEPVAAFTSESHDQIIISESETFTEAHGAGCRISSDSGPLDKILKDSKGEDARPTVSSAGFGGSMRSLSSEVSLLSDQHNFTRPMLKWQRFINACKNTNLVKVNPAWHELIEANLVRGEKQHVASIVVQNWRSSKGNHSIENKRRSFASHIFDLEFMDKGSKTRLHRCLQAAGRFKPKSICLLHPNSWTRVTWDIAGMFLLIHDFVMIPLQVFDSGTGGLGDAYMNFWVALDFLASIFWTCDIFVSFITAYHSEEGFVENNRCKIARHYMKTWFPLDLSIVTIDWIGYLLNFDSDAGFIRMGKVISRFLRVLRLLRLMKMSEKLNEVVQTVNSEYILTIVGVSKLLIGIIMVNHYIACTWYWLSRSAGEKTWSTKFLKQQEDFDYAYLTSMHWSLTQFTPASMEVHPTNAYERIYTIVVIVGAMVTFSSFVSSITGAMTHLRMINAKKAETDAAFRQYFSTNKVSIGLARQVWHFRRHNVKVSRSRMKESDLPALSYLPSRLREMLRLEVFFPILSPHPVFALLSDLSPDAILQTCNEALSERRMLPGEELKEISSSINTMIFVCHGFLKFYIADSQPKDRGFKATFSDVYKGARYSVMSHKRKSQKKKNSKQRVSRAFRTAMSITSNSRTAHLGRSMTRLSRLPQFVKTSTGSDTFVKVMPGEWAYELSLWSSEGTTAGHFIGSETGCDLVMLSGEKFRSILKKHKAVDGINLIGYYALVFVEHFNEACLDSGFKNILFNDVDMLCEFVEESSFRISEVCSSSQRVKSSDSL